MWNFTALAIKDGYRGGAGGAAAPPPESFSGEETPGPPFSVALCAFLLLHFFTAPPTNISCIRYCLQYRERNVTSEDWARFFGLSLNFVTISTYWRFVTLCLYGYTVKHFTTRRKRGNVQRDVQCSSCFTVTIPYRRACRGSFCVFFNELARLSLFVFYEK